MNDVPCKICGIELDETDIKIYHNEYDGPYCLDCASNIFDLHFCKNCGTYIDELDLLLEDDEQNEFVEHYLCPICRRKL